MVHRAVFGSLERFYGILVEHYGGAFPLWLAPVQVRVLTLSDRHVRAARTVLERLARAGIRAEEDFKNEKMGHKIREAELQKIPYIMVMGDKEVETNSVAVRKRGRQDLGAQSLEDWIRQMNEEIRGKK